jgi:hypothetical protein
MTHPVVPVAETLFLDSLDISLLLEHLGVLCHVLRRLETVKVADVRLAIEHRDERSGRLSQGRKLGLLEEWQSLDIGESSDSVFRMGDQAIDQYSFSIQQALRTYCMTASHAESDKLKIKSSGRS